MGSRLPEEVLGGQVTWGVGQGAGDLEGALGGAGYLEGGPEGNRLPRGFLGGAGYMGGRSWG